MHSFFPVAEGVVCVLCVWFTGAICTGFMYEIFETWQKWVGFMYELMSDIQKVDLGCVSIFLYMYMFLL